MKTNTLRKRIGKLLLLTLAILLCTSLLQELLLYVNKSNRNRVKDFYLEKKDTVDVVFIGASEVYCDFAPGYAYELFGYTSYPFVTQGSTVRNFTTAVKEAVRTQHPKLIVIEINGALYDEVHYNKEAYARYFIDSIPLNRNKAEYIENNITEHKAEYYLPIIKYHGSWTELPNCMGWAASAAADRLRGYSLLKGIKQKTDIRPMRREELYNLRPGVEKERYDLIEEARADLVELLEYCRREDLPVLFVRFPHGVKYSERVRLGRAGTAGDLIREYGFDFISFDYRFDDIGLDPEKDFYNPEHLNIYGQKKFTAYFSRLIMEKYGVSPSQLDEKTRGEWDNCAAYYDAFARLNMDWIEKGKTAVLNDDLRTYRLLMPYLK